MKGYKAFEKGLVCKGKQYAENTIFEEELPAEICQRGMHFCINPLNVLDYYPLVNENGEIPEFAEVEALDDCKTDDYRKYCTKKLKIGKKISFDKFVEAGVNFERAASTGTEVKTTSENFAKVCSSNKFVQLGGGGDYVQIASSGICAHIASSGRAAKICTSGDGTRIGSSGGYAKICSIGNYAFIGSSGDYAQINSIGKHSVICCVGCDSIAKGKIGSWITLAEWEYSEEERKHIVVCVKTEKIDGERIKEDTYYRLQNGEFVEVKE